MPARGTRPTSERVREALFGRLEHDGRLAGAAVLDLFAGSGALGLEAASRGARRVVLVEAARPAARTCRDNAAALGLDDVVEVVVGRAETYAAATPEAFDLVLLDPPYDADDAAVARVLEALSRGRVTPGGQVVVERARRAGAPPWPAAWHPAGERRYGDTVLWFATVET